MTIESSGQGVFSCKSDSSGLNALGIKLGKSSSSQEGKESNFDSKINTFSKDHTIISYGSKKQPATSNHQLFAIN